MQAYPGETTIEPLSNTTFKKIVLHDTDDKLVLDGDFSIDKSLLMPADDHDIYIINCNNNITLDKYPTNGVVFSVVFHHDGKEHVFEDHNLMIDFIHSEKKTNIKDN